MFSRNTYIGTSESSWNKYDVILFILVVSLFFGTFGSPVTVVRVLSIVLLPLMLKVLTFKIYTYIRPFMIYFMIWYLYMLISMFWTSDAVEGMKELLYYFLNFVLFFEFIIFSRLAKRPLLTISVAWITAFLLTSTIALWEIITDHHLYLSKLSGDRLRNNGLEAIHFRFASVTFYNYNNYGLFICYCLPFIFYSLMGNRDRIIRYLSIISIFLSVYILFTNSSRGSILSLLIMSLIYIIYMFFEGNKKQRHTLLFILLAMVLLLVKYGKLLLYQFMFRMTNTEILEDYNRTSVLKDAWHLFLDTFGFGTGVGSMVASLAKIRGESADILVPHNIFMEMLMQHGFIFTLVPTLFLLYLFMISTHLPKGQKLVIFCALLPFPFFGVTSSGYLLSSSLWCFIATIYIFSKRDYVC